MRHWKQTSVLPEFVVRGSAPPMFARILGAVFVLVAIAGGTSFPLEEERPSPSADESNLRPAPVSPERHRGEDGRDATPAPPEVTPSEITVRVIEGRSAVRTVTLRNSGTRRVSWTVSKGTSPPQTAPPTAALRAGTTGPRSGPSRGRLLRRVREDGQLRVIVEVDVPVVPEKTLSPSAVQAQRQRIEAVQQRVVSAVRPRTSSVWTSDYVPFLVLTVDEEGLRRLLDRDDVVRVVEDTADPLHLDTSTELIGATEAWSMGYTGQGQTVVILDTGISVDHPFLEDSVVQEACFSTEDSSRGIETLCPNENESQLGEGAACNRTLGGCGHGTHVAGIAVGDADGRSGVAPDANLVAVQVFSRFNDAEDCDGNAPCKLAFRSDQLQGLEYAYDLRDEHNIAAVNMSLGGGSYGTYCNDDDSRTAIIRQLRAAGAATVTSAGNDERANALSAPACLRETIAVGSTQDRSSGTVDAISPFSNSAWMLDFWAPGEQIESSTPFPRYQELSGTSMASPHVAGAWALLKSKWPGASVNEVQARLDDAGIPVTDPRNGIVRPRLEVGRALRRNERVVVGPTYGAVPAGGEEKITVVLDAADLSPGTYRDTLTIALGDQNPERVAVTTEVVEASPARANIRPQTLRGATRTGTPLELEQSVTNAADSTGQTLRVRPLLPSFLSLDRVLGEGVTTSDSTIQIRPQATATLIYRFEQTAERFTVYEDTLRLRTNDPDAGDVGISTELAVRVPRIAVDPSVVEFGIVPSGETTTSDVTLTNVGSAPFEASATVTSGTDKFAVAENAGPISVPPGERRTITVSSEATAAEIRKGVLEVTHDAVNLGSPTRIDLESAPGELVLRPPYPNPLRTNATIEYSIPEQTEVRISVYDLLGRRVAVLKRKREEAGIHQVQWTGRAADGSALANGPYFVRLRTEEAVRTEKFTIVR